MPQTPDHWVDRYEEHIEDQLSSAATVSREALRMIMDIAQRKVMREIIADLLRGDK